MRCKWVLYPGTSFTIDTLSLIPESIVVTSKGQKLAAEYNPTVNEISIDGVALNDSIQVCYRVLPVNLTQEYRHRDLQLYDSLKVYRDNLHYDSPYAVQERREELFSSPGLNKTGNLSRGLSFGNNQNVSVNSNLNIQLEGQLTDDVSILASISDQNIPFQPEGNTATLQEFDRVYLKLYTERTELSAGDLRITNNENSYFLRYLKNVQGGQLTTRYGTDSTYRAETSIGAAISKGKFHSIILEAKEGVQGPYKLRGPDGERFVVVLANSEKVFLDGERLQRGFDYDYVIDYNNGEVTFTNNVIITKFSRIRVDFEYSDLNYSRTTINASHYQEAGKVDFFVNYYSEKDNRNNPLNIDLEDADKIILSEAGDDPLLAVVPSYNFREFSPNRVLYKVDTLTIDATPTPVFIYSTNADSAFYEVAFSQVGAGNGNYVRKNTTANGIVYEFVPPIGGVPQGEYEPVQLLPAPRKKQMVSAGLGYDFTPHEHFKSEFAFSDIDRNLFSEIDNEDNQGYAYKVGVETDGRKVLDGDYKLNSSVDFEYNEENFNRIDRFRYIEFDRDWSADDAIAGRNVFVNGAVGIQKDRDNIMRYSLSYRDKANDVEGTQQRFVFNKSISNFFIRSDGFFLNSKTATQTSNWDRLNTDFSWRQPVLTSGVKYQLDKNTLTNTQGKVTGTAMYFDALTGYIRTSDTSKVFTSLDYTYREDQDTLKDGLALANVSHTANLVLAANYGEGNLLKLRTTYRQLENVGAFSAIENDRTLMNRLDWNTSFFQRVIRSELTIASVTAREAKRDFLFLPIFDGSGTHVYVGDFNKNGVQDIDEFALKGETVFDTTYVKTFVPSDEFIEAYNTTINYRLNVSTPKDWARSAGLKKLLSRFSNISSWSLDKKITNEDFGKRFNPFAAITEDDLISFKEQLRLTFFYNRSNPKYGMDLNYFSNKSKQLLTNGFDSLAVNEWRLNTRMNIQRKFNFKLGGSTMNKTSFSDFLQNKNYRILANSVFPELSFQPGNVFRITGKYKYTGKVNEQGDETADLSETSMNFIITEVNKRTLNLQINHVMVKTNQEDGFSSTILGFDMMNGLKEGVNWTWQVNFQQKIANGLQFNLTYDGRKSPGVPAVHIGRMQVAALF